MAGRAQAWCEPILLRELVNALAVVSLAGLDLQTHFLAQIAGKEAAHGMGLPAGGFHEVFQSGAAGPFQQFQHPGGLTAFLAEVAFLAHLALAGATRGFGAATLAFWGGSGFSAAVAVAWAGSRFSVVDIVMVHAPSAVITAVTTWITRKRSHCKRSLWKLGKGDGMAMRAGNTIGSARCARVASLAH